MTPNAEARIDVDCAVTIEVALASPVDRWGWPTATTDESLLRLTVQYDPDGPTLVLHLSPANPAARGRMIDILVTGLGPALPCHVRQDGMTLHCPVPFRIPGPRWHRLGAGSLRVFTTVGDHVITID